MSFFNVVGFLTVGSSIACCVSSMRSSSSTTTTVTTGPAPGPAAEEEPEVVVEAEPIEIEETSENYMIAPFGTFDTIFK
jgi:hypothetical protein